MTFDEYQRETRKTALFATMDFAVSPVYYTALGLWGESGEVGEHIKKMIRDDDGVLTEERQAKLKDELGDVLWYLAQLATELGLSMDGIAQRNIDKLASRQQRGVLHGSGSDR